MDDLIQQVRDFFKEQGEAEEDALRRLGVHRTQARALIEGRALPALSAVANAVNQHGRRVQVTPVFDPIDSPFVGIAIKRYAPDRHGFAEEVSEFGYTLKASVSPRALTVSTEIWPRSALPRPTPDQEDRMKAAGVVITTVEPNDLTQDMIANDVLAEYTAYLRSERQ